MTRLDRASAWVVAAAALVLAVLAYGSGVDRMSERAPFVAAAVPAPLRAAAWRSEAERALGRHPSRAIAAAERAVARDPIDPRATALLGAARYAAGDGAGAAAGFRVAGQLGWREPRTQLYWLIAALGSGELEVAGERLDALLRQSPNHPQLADLVAPFEVSPAGRRLLARRLSARPSWLPPYLGRLDGLSPVTLRDRAAVLAEPALHRGAITCPATAPLAEALFVRGAYAEARGLWRRYCPFARGPVADPGFEHVRLDTPSPFDWQFAGEGGLDIIVGEARGFTGKAVTVASSSARRVGFAVQVVQLPPGRYRLSWRAAEAGGAPSRRIAAALDCRLEGPGAASAPAPEPGGRFASELAVPAGCPVQWLKFAIDPGEGAVTFDDAALRPL